MIPTYIRGIDLFNTGFGLMLLITSPVVWGRVLVAILVVIQVFYMVREVNRQARIDGARTMAVLIDQCCADDDPVESYLPPTSGSATPRHSSHSDGDLPPQPDLDRESE